MGTTGRPGWPPRPLITCEACKQRRGGDRGRRMGIWERGWPPRGCMAAMASVRRLRGCLRTRCTLPQCGRLGPLRLRPRCSRACPARRPARSTRRRPTHRHCHRAPSRRCRPCTCRVATGPMAPSLVGPRTGNHRPSCLLPPRHRQASGTGGHRRLEPTPLRCRLGLALEGGRCPPASRGWRGRPLRATRRWGPPGVPNQDRSPLPRRGGRSWRSSRTGMCRAVRLRCSGGWRTCSWGGRLQQERPWTKQQHRLLERTDETHQATTSTVSRGGRAASPPRVAGRCRLQRQTSSPVWRMRGMEEAISMR